MIKVVHLESGAVVIGIKDTECESKNGEERYVTSYLDGKGVEWLIRELEKKGSGD